MRATREVIVVGGGLSGLVAAAELEKSGVDVLVLDKGNRVGGRLASRRIRGAQADHGAQFFTTREMRFQRYVQEWEELGVTRVWYRTGDQNHPHWRGAPSMQSIAEHLSRRVEVILNQRVVRLRNTPDGWAVECESGEGYVGRALIMTPPVPQTLDVFEKSGLPLSEPRRIDLDRLIYDPCIAVIGTLAGPMDVPEPGFVRPKSDIIAWIADNRQKGIASDPSFTIHTEARYSNVWGTKDKEAILQEVLAEAQPVLSSAVIDAEVHYWRYAKARTRHSSPHMTIMEQQPLILAGDSFGGSRVEGAAMSGFSASDTMMNLL